MHGQVLNQKHSKPSRFNLKHFALVLGFALATPTILNGCGALIVSGTSAIAGSQVSQDSRSVTTMLYDEQIEQNAVKILRSNSLLSQDKDFRISITAYNGNVLVTGQTINRDYLKWCVSKIEKLEHVRKVYNYATLQKPVSASVISSDSLLTSQVKTQLLFGKGITSNRFKVVTENGNVFLMGIVNHDEAKRAANTVKSIEGVRKVYLIFDYIQVTTTEGNVSSSSDNYVVAPEKGYQAEYKRPQRNSTYVPPVQNQQNGGAYIVEDTSNNLLAPSSGY